VVASFDWQFYKYTNLVIIVLSPEVRYPQVRRIGHRKTCFLGGGGGGGGKINKKNKKKKIFGVFFVF
jgi:hypothetical protein